MGEVLKTLAIRLAVCAAIGAALWRLMGIWSFAVSGTLCGLALARPLVELGAALWQQMRRQVWRDVQGRHFTFKGQPVRVVEDADHQRWVRLADIRSIAGFTASDAALRVTYPKGWQMLGRPAEPYLSDETLLAHLAKERTPIGAKLRHWVEREIVFPARRQRERHGIRIEALDFRSSSD